MAKKGAEDLVTEETDIVVGDAKEIKKDETVIYFKAIKPLTTQEHENLHEKIEIEMKKTGLKIILVPFLVEISDIKE
ncbi:hypothetical protein [Clostridium beijerinckii]|uniref:hypothetical protein n=1 Tax=Clostridium beijerinckii TaxID=1520 RepID=UPI0014946A38|nr:hypothetical protein [Clostridium beijerinckii]NOW07851.1 hypothetical protein [Clostridium beijerinckii]NYC05482.1 hypothetical protein [Clostridium beijerinckii]